MDNLIWNERLKLLANALDRASTACFAAGSIGPFATLVFVNGATGLSAGQFTLAAVCWILFGIGLHLLAQQVLRGLR